MVTKFIRSKGVFEIFPEVPSYGLGSQRHVSRSKNEET